MRGYPRRSSTARKANRAMKMRKAATIAFRSGNGGLRRERTDHQYECTEISSATIRIEL